MRALVIIISVVVVFAGCGAKKYFVVPIDHFSIKMYHNNKSYTATKFTKDIEGLQVVQELSEIPISGEFINSFLIVKMPLISGLDGKRIVETNIKKNETKLLKYQAKKLVEHHVSCDTQEYSGYVSTFSYQGEKELLYAGQYYIVGSGVIYTLSLVSDDQDDINRFAKKTIKTISCKQKK